MSEHTHRTVERHCDVVVVGASAAALDAALELGRQRRSVIVIDADGTSGAPALEEVRSHGGEILAGRALAVTPVGDDRLRVALAGGHAVVARRVLSAAELADAGTDTSQAAAGDGRRIGATVAAELSHEDLSSADRPSGNEADWDHRYAGEPLWSGNPNGSLVAEAGALPTGRALDVGAGEGGDALWLAEQGWDVTASDVSRLVLDRVADAAARRGLTVACLHADANAPDAFPAGAFDLVSAHYASIPRTPDHRAERNLLDAVAPGGVLLVVGHDLEPMRAAVDTEHDSRAFDADAYVRVDDVAATLAAAPEWDIEVHEKRPRPPGAASAHHVDDVILRARRRTG